MTTIQALTGIHPYFLPINHQSNQVQWQDLAPVSTSLAAILNRMVCEDYRDRYQSASEIKNLLIPFVPTDLSGHKSPTRFFQESKAVPLASIIQRQTKVQPASCQKDVPVPAPTPAPSRYILNRVLAGSFVLTGLAIGAMLLTPTANKKSSPVTASSIAPLPNSSVNRNKKSRITTIQGH
jgi:serine/threonine protein kinase